MLDFTSALYLGLRHPHGGLAPWRTLTEGRPAVLGEPAGAAAVAGRLARLMGLPQALLFPSTLHLFLDLFDTIAREPVMFFWATGLYPSLRWPIERAAGTGVPERAFNQHRHGDLARALARRPAGRTPIVVTTGLCPGCGGLAPLRELLKQTAAEDGVLIVDDTQALGVLGTPAPEAPLGRGGGGSARFLGLASARLLVGASLAKAFGVPVAVLAGVERLLARIARSGPTRWHASPVSAAALAAAAHALDVNDRHGDRLRAHLSSLSIRLGTGFEEMGLGRVGPPLPVRSTIALPLRTAQSLYAALEARGLRCLLRGSRGGEGAVLTFLLTAAHNAAAVDAALVIIGRCWAQLGYGRPNTGGGFRSNEGRV